MKKKINTDALASELRDHSAFFRRPTPPQAQEPTAVPPTPEPHHDPTLPHQTLDSTRTPRTGRTAPTPPKRYMRRHPFEVYQDQVDQLRQLAAEERMQGGVGSMSKMVRDAIDRLLEEKRGDKDRGEQ